MLVGVHAKVGATLDDRAGGRVCRNSRRGDALERYGEGRRSVISQRAPREGADRGSIAMQAPAMARRLQLAERDNPGRKVPSGAVCAESSRTWVAYRTIRSIESETRERS
jgi:hypothetical protein